MSQPNLSLSIKRLEEEISRPIFERTSTGVTLTDFGKKFVRHCEGIMLQMDRLEKLCREQDIAVPLELRVAAVGFRFVNVAIGEIYNRYKTNPVIITYLDAAMPDQVGYLQNGTVEIGIITVNGFERRQQMRYISGVGLEYHYLCPARTGVYVGKDNKDFPDVLKREHLSLLHEHPIVSYHPLDILSRGIFGYLRDQYGMNIRARNTVFVQNNGAMRDFVNRLDGYSVATYCDTVYNDRVQFYTDLRFVPFEEGLLTSEIGWIQKRNTQRSLLAEEFVQTLTQMIAH